MITKKLAVRTVLSGAGISIFGYSLSLIATIRAIRYCSTDSLGCRLITDFPLSKIGITLAYSGIAVIAVGLAMLIYVAFKKK